MNILKMRFLFALMLLLAFLPACSRPTARPDIMLQPCTGYWHYSKVLCGTLSVLENRQDPGGRMIDLKVVVIKATSDKPAPDPIFYLAGGPGGAAASDDARYQKFPTSLSLTMPYQGHQISNPTMINCYFSVMNDFIQTGTAKGLDTSCLQNIQPPAFVVP